jgi:Na+/H+ antiporter NhaC
MKFALLAQHVGLFVLLVLIVSVVYNGLRREDVHEIVKVGLKRGVFFVLVSLLVFGAGGYLLAQWL